MACIHGRDGCPACHPERVFRRYQRQALERNLAFQITLEQFEKIVQEPCVFCGEAGDPRGLDRRNNDLGYLPGNIRACCSVCNRFKSNLTEHEFLAHAKKITEHQELLRQQEALRRQAEQQQAPPTPEPRKPDPTPEGRRWDPSIPEAARRYLEGF
jgi:hypothetical protein